jgi:hypothetical protein
MPPIPADQVKPLTEYDDEGGKAITFFFLFFNILIFLKHINECYFILVKLDGSPSMRGRGRGGRRRGRGRGKSYCFAIITLQNNI